MANPESLGPSVSYARTQQDYRPADGRLAAAALLLRQQATASRGRAGPRFFSEGAGYYYENCRPRGPCWRPGRVGTRVCGIFPSETVTRIGHSGHCHDGFGGVVEFRGS